MAISLSRFWLAIFLIFSSSCVSALPIARVFDFSQLESALFDLKDGLQSGTEGQASEAFRAAFAAFRRLRVASPVPDGAPDFLGDAENDVRRAFDQYQGNASQAQELVMRAAGTIQLYYYDFTHHPSGPLLDFWISHFHAQVREFIKKWDGVRSASAVGHHTDYLFTSITVSLCLMQARSGVNHMISGMPAVRHRYLEAMAYHALSVRQVQRLQSELREPFPYFSPQRPTKLPGYLVAHPGRLRRRTK